MQQLVILLLINCSSICFGDLYAHHQEVRLRCTAYVSCCSCCDVGDSDGKLRALCGVGYNLLHTVHTVCPKHVEEQLINNKITNCCI